MLRIPRQVRNTGTFTVLFGVCFAAASLWFERQSRQAVDAELILQAAGYSTKLFALGITLIGVGIFEIYRARTKKRLAELDQQIAALRKSIASRPHDPQPDAVGVFPATTTTPDQRQPVDA
jgi:hypothetical protein